MGFKIVAYLTKGSLDQNANIDQHTRPFIPRHHLFMLAYTNRFLALATLIRNLNSKYKLEHEDRNQIKEQIKNLRKRLSLIKQMQASGIISFFCCVLCTMFFYLEHEVWAYTIFGLSLGFLLLSLMLSLSEIYLSTKALEIELKDMLEE